MVEKPFNATFFLRVVDTEAESESSSSVQRWTKGFCQQSRKDCGSLLEKRTPKKKGCLQSSSKGDEKEIVPVAEGDHSMKMTIGRYLLRNRHSRLFSRKMNAPANLPKHFTVFCDTDGRLTVRRKGVEKTAPLGLLVAYYQISD
jgi:hypothetical protein